MRCWVGRGRNACVRQTPLAFAPASHSFSIRTIHTSETGEERIAHLMRDGLRLTLNEDQRFI